MSGWDHAAMTTPTTSPHLVPDPGNTESLLHRLDVDFGAALACAGVVIGHRFGIYRALADGGPQTLRELAGRTGIEKRYAREWLCEQAGRGYVTYDARAETFALTPEQAACLADDASPTFIGGAFQLALERWEHVFRQTRRV